MNKTITENNILIILSIMFLLALLPIAAAETITTFNSSSSTLSLFFDDSTKTNSFYIEIPNSGIRSAKTTIRGLDYSGNYVLPADVVLVTDTSGSMNEVVSSTDSTTKMAAAKAADLQFLNSVDMSVVHVGLVEYNSCPTLLHVEELTSIKSVLEETINLYRGGGSTNMGLGMMRAIDELTSSRSQNTERKFMLLMTDGQANQQADENYVCSSGNGYEYSREAARRAAEEGIVIYGIGFGTNAAESLLKEIVQITGGTYYFAPSSSELEQIYNEIAEEINEQQFPIPSINTKVPKSIMNAWRYPEEYSYSAVWSQNGCGIEDAQCEKFDSVLQQNLDECTQDICKIVFNVNSNRKGTIELSNLVIETGGIECKDKKEYLLYKDFERTIILDEIFNINGDPGDPETLIEDYVPPQLVVSPNMPEFEMSVLTDSADIFDVTAQFSVETNTGYISDSCPVDFTTDSSRYGEIICATTRPEYYVENGQSVTVAIADVFTISGPNPGTPNQLIQEDNTHIEIAPNLPNSFVATNGGVDGSETAYLRLITSTGVMSGLCPVTIKTGDFLCQDEKKEYLVYADYEKQIDLNEIFFVDKYPGNPETLIEDSGTENLDIIPNMPEFEMSVLSNTQTLFHTTGYFTIQTDSGYESESCPADFTNDDSNYGRITCADTIPEFKLYQGESLDIPVSDIFVITGPNPGTPTELVQNDDSGVLLTSDLPTHIIATPDGINGLETSYVRILTDNQVVSDLCPIRFTTGDDFGKLGCVSPAPNQRLLDSSEALDMSFYDIFTFEGDYGTLVSFEEVSGTSNLDIIPYLDEYYMSVLPIGEVTTTAFLSLTTSKNVRPNVPCPASFLTNEDDIDDIYCKPNAPKYVVQEGHITTVDLNEIYTFESDIGKLDELIKVSGTDALEITPRLEDEEMDVEKVDNMIGIKKLDLKIKTTYGVKETCPVYFEDLGANCDTDECGACFNALENTYDCLELNSCFDGRISVLNPSVKVRLANIKHALINQIFDVKEYDVFSRDGPNFVITSDTSPANQDSIFDISGTNVEDGKKGVGSFKLEIPYFEAGNRVRICPNLIRLNYNIGLEPEIIDSDLLVTSSTVVPGYFEEEGFVYSKGPYIFTAKAWLR